MVSVLLLVMTVGLSFSPPIRAQDADSLYVGDRGDNTVKYFGATNGSFLGAFVKRSLAGLHGPGGLLFEEADLIVSDQNVGTATNGEILQYSETGTLLERLVPNSDPNAPAVPRGIIIFNNILFVADFSNETRPNKPTGPGRLMQYNATSGAFMNATRPPDTSPLYCGHTNQGSGEFHPRGIVVGPDRLLYVSNFPCPDDPPPQLGGQVLRFDREGNFVDVFITSDIFNDLNRPEGLVFGPDGNLYITSFTGGVASDDKILIFRGPNGRSPGKFISQINLDDLTKVDTPRAFAQALLFGPGGKLFVPISGSGPDTGSVRSYDVSTKTFEVFVKPGGPLELPWYLTFGNTSPSSLAYGSQN